MRSNDSHLQRSGQSGNGNDYDISTPFDPSPHGDQDHISIHSGNSDAAPADDLNELDIDALYNNATMEDTKTAFRFIKKLQEASLEDSGLSQNAIDLLRNPPQQRLNIEDDADLQLSLELYLGLGCASEDMYRIIAQKAILNRYPDSQILSFEQVKQRSVELSGVVQIKHDMCPNTCLAYTGPFAKYTRCPECDAHRYDQTIYRNTGGQRLVPVREFCTIPIGPRLQASWRDPQGVESMRHRERQTRDIFAHRRADDGSIEIGDYEDFIHGQDYITAVSRKEINEGDIVLMFSIDGAQLYQSKASDCWIYIWVVMNHPPEVRYQKRYVLPGAIIPGPNKPKNIDSFFFPGLHHLSALQKEGLRIWDSVLDEIFISQIHLTFATADAPAMPYLNGLVGHHGRLGCRLFCGTIGRHRAGKNHYYPALLKPTPQYAGEQPYRVMGCDHDDVDITSISTDNSVSNYYAGLSLISRSRGDAQYKRDRLETGVAKPSLFLGLPPGRILPLPRIFPTDIMHLASLNLTDIMLSLWRGELEAILPDSKSNWEWRVLHGDVWRAHGKAVADAKPYFPGSFDRPPRNIAEKINSGYKAREYQNYFYGLGPGLFLEILPRHIYSHYCKLVYGIRVMHQHKISASQLMHAHQMLLEFVRDYEIIYYQRKTTRLHFVRQSIHTLTHLGPEVVCVGPLGCHSQWTLERTIGNLGEEIKQHSNPYANLSERGVRRCQDNALMAMAPILDNSIKSKPRGSQDIGNGYMLLRKKDRYDYKLNSSELYAITVYLSDTMGRIVEASDLGISKIKRWARVSLPVGQIARSRWKEASTSKQGRISRNVKVRHMKQYHLN